MGRAGCAGRWAKPACARLALLPGAHAQACSPYRPRPPCPPQRLPPALLGLPSLASLVLSNVGLGMDGPGPAAAAQVRLGSILGGWLARLSDFCLHFLLTEGTGQAGHSECMRGRVPPRHARWIAV